MHGGEHGSGADHTLTQAQADSCCASSESDPSNPSSPAFVAATSSAILGPAVVLPAIVPALVLTDAWRTVVPAPAAAVPRHVLLSTFLV